MDYAKELNIACTASAMDILSARFLNKLVRKQVLILIDWPNFLFLKLVSNINDCLIKKGNFESGHF